MDCESVIKASRECFEDFWRKCGAAGPTGRPGQLRRLALAAWLAGAANAADLAEHVATRSLDAGGSAADLRAAISAVAGELDRAAVNPSDD